MPPDLKDIQGHVSRIRDFTQDAIPADPTELVRKLWGYAAAAAQEEVQRLALDALKKLQPAPKPASNKLFEKTPPSRDPSDDLATLVKRAFTSRATPPKKIDVRDIQGHISRIQDFTRDAVPSNPTELVRRLWGYAAATAPEEVQRLAMDALKKLQASPRSSAKPLEKKPPAPGTLAVHARAQALGALVKRSLTLRSTDPKDIAEFEKKVLPYRLSADPRVCEAAYQILYLLNAFRSNARATLYLPPSERFIHRANAWHSWLFEFSKCSDLDLAHLEILRDFVTEILWPHGFTAKANAPVYLLGTQKIILKELLDAWKSQKNLHTARALQVFLEHVTTHSNDQKMLSKKDEPFIIFDSSSVDAHSLDNRIWVFAQSLDAVKPAVAAALDRSKHFSIHQMIVEVPVAPELFDAFALNEAVVASPIPGLRLEDGRDERWRIQSRGQIHLRDRKGKFVAQKVPITFNFVIDVPPPNHERSPAPVLSSAKPKTIGLRGSGHSKKNYTASNEARTKLELVYRRSESDTPFPSASLMNGGNGIQGDSTVKMRNGWIHLPDAGQRAVQSALAVHATSPRHTNYSIRRKRHSLAHAHRERMVRQKRRSVLRTGRLSAIALSSRTLTAMRPAAWMRSSIRFR